MTKQTLTSKQQTLYEFIVHYISEHHQSPLIREIQAACQITSYKSAVDRLNAVERKGFIRRLPNKHRGIKLAQRMAASTPQLPETVSLQQPLSLPRTL